MTTRHDPGLVVRPVRFTDDPAAMRAFLEALGLAARVESENGGWVDLVAEGGMVALHSAADSDTGGVAGETRLSFEADDVDGLAARLRAAGFADVHVYDEAYGRVLAVTDPEGDPLHIDERTGDLYGYRLHAIDRARPGRWVAPVRFTGDGDRYAAFLRALGLTGKTNERYSTLRAADGAHGYIGLHPPMGALAGGCRLSLTVADDLAVLASSLREAGYADATLVQEHFGDVLSVTDPDGQTVELHAPPAAEHPNG
jgi:hypothetical protein